MDTLFRIWHPTSDVHGRFIMGHGGPFAPMMVGALGPLVISSWRPSESPGPLGCRVPVDQGASEAMTGDEHG